MVQNIGLFMNCNHVVSNAAIQVVYQWNKGVSVNAASVYMAHVDQAVKGLTGHLRSVK